MASRAERTDPGLWEKIKASIQQGDKGGEPGQWSARKAQMAVQEYKRRGGGYQGPKTTDNSLKQWTEEDWGTRSGKPSAETGERYLPRHARDHLSKADYQRTSDKKRADTKKGKQFSRQPDDVARKTAPFRHRTDGEWTRAALYEKAKQRNLPGRSRMTKEELQKALS
ncbi:DUF5872 domain-containing protein [Azospirillum brasilense]|uniref:DUF5872 domain-containing protein n=1 Tax=Azospirillum brasilense TaxID=192 RepID=A0A235HGX7_AZOBR|nr:DUF5872 domain-containing protein [Azospirillum brasilense]OYD84936.1 hypothetical protein CHT98_08555 [Azospirillum brasilense]